MRDRALVRLAVIPLAAYLLLTTTVHPWYVTLLVPLLPFLASESQMSPQRLVSSDGGGEGELGMAAVGGRLLLALLWFSAVVPLSYLTYLDPTGFRDYAAVRLAEYVPLYLMLVWAAWPAIVGAAGSGRGPGRPRRQSQPRT